MVLVNYCYELKKQNQYAHEVQVRLKFGAVSHCYSCFHLNSEFTAKKLTQTTGTTIASGLEDSLA